MTPIHKDLKKDITTFVFTWNAYKRNYLYDSKNNNTTPLKILPLKILQTILSQTKKSYKPYINQYSDSLINSITYKNVIALCNKKKNVLYNNRLNFLKNKFGVGKSKNKEIQTFHIEREIIKHWVIPEVHSINHFATILTNTGGVNINNLIMKFLLRFKPVERLKFLKGLNLLKI